MIPLRHSAQTVGVVFLLASSLYPLTSALDVNICASINTGTTSRNTSIYQTNGLCHDWCINDYAYAITQNNACWCSNYVPAKSSRENTGSCNKRCPGYPSEACGGDGLYGYISLSNVQPSGTRGAESSTATTDAKTTAVISKVTETVQNTVTVVSSETAASTTNDSSTKSSTTADAPSSSTIQTVTADGIVKTVYVGPTGTANAASDTTAVSTKSSGLSTGAVAGIVVGIIAAVIAGAGVALFLWFRRRKQRNEQQGFQDDPSIRDSSSATRPEMSTAGVSPVSPTAAKRNSTLQVDPRMDPFKQGLYVRSGSHESINTLRDDHDYSRRIQPKVLRATNPDPVM